MIRKLLVDIFRGALAAVDPYEAVKKALLVKDKRIHVKGEVYDLDLFDRVIVVGAGKAVARMALAVEESLGNALSGGLIIVKYGHTAFLRMIDQTEAAHPLPDSAGLQGTQKIIELLHSADEKTLVIFLVSGGGSALLVLPLPGVTLEEKQRVTDLLLKAGASINEVNAVRKHLSAVKGGRLAQKAYPASILTLILSDVIGNSLDVIASGPTAPDATTFTDAISVIEKYSLRQLFPETVLALIERGMKGQEPETAKNADPCFVRTRNFIVGGIDLALSAARNTALAADVSSEIKTAELQGDVQDAARLLGRTALQTRDSLKPGERRCLLFGGETTVKVRGEGLGGRNQELALAFALDIEGAAGITLLSAGTDGTDGPTDAAGAIVDGETAKRARDLGIDPRAYLERNDSYSFFKRFDLLAQQRSHLVTGPTGTNVMDIQIIFIEKDASVHDLYSSK